MQFSTLVVVLASIASIAYSKKVVARSVDIYCPETFEYNKDTKECELIVPDELDVMFDDLTGVCVHGTCPFGQTCINENNIPVCISDEKAAPLKKKK
uniref:Secreted protein n=1 Tax=Rhabditophanes sp. KR3021 TaxID=114890 RepID=A0AC35UE79_9BILA